MALLMAHNPYGQVAKGHLTTVPATQQICERCMCKQSTTIKAFVEGGDCNVPAVPVWCDDKKCKMMHFVYDVPLFGVKSVAMCPCPYMRATGDCKYMDECPFDHALENRSAHDNYYQYARNLLTPLMAIANQETISEEEFHTCEVFISGLCQHIYRSREKHAVMKHVKDVLAQISKIVVIRSANPDRNRVEMDHEILACFVKELLPLELNLREELLNTFVDRAYIGTSSRQEMKQFAVAVFKVLTRGVKLAELTKGSWADDESDSLYTCVEHLAQLAVLDQSGKIPAAADTKKAAKKGPQQLQALVAELKTKELHEWMRIELEE